MTRAQSIAAAVFAVVAGGLLLASLTVTFAISAGAPEVLRLPFRLICHGIVDRSFHAWGEPMPICFRCSAIYIGMLVGIGASIPWARTIQTSFPGWLAVILATPMIVDGSSQLLGLRESTNELRIITGLMAGFGFLLWAVTNIGVGSAGAGSRIDAPGHRK